MNDRMKITLASGKVLFADISAPYTIRLRGRCGPCVYLEGFATIQSFADNLAKPLFEILGDGIDKIEWL